METLTNISNMLHPFVTCNYKRSVFLKVHILFSYYDFKMHFLIKS